MSQYRNKNVRLKSLIQGVKTVIYKYKYALFEQPSLDDCTAEVNWVFATLLSSLVH